MLKKKIIQYVSSLQTRNQMYYTGSKVTDFLITLDFVIKF